MANSGVNDAKKLLSDVLDKMTSLETKLTSVDGELSTVKLDQLRHNNAEKQLAAFPGLRLPEYDGTDDPDIWLHRFELLFDLQRTEEDKIKVCLAAFHMTGKAQIWYYGHQRNNGGGGVRPTWPQFAELVRRRFGDPMKRNAFGDLIQLRQTGSVAEYREEFLGLVDRCDGGVNETMQLVFFTNGLRAPLRKDVEQRHPETLQDAVWMARVLEEYLMKRQVI